MAQPARRLMTVAEFLTWDDGTDRRYELIDGVPIMMAPPNPVHSAVAYNLALSVGSRLAADWEGRIEAGIRLPHRPRSYYIADVAWTRTKANRRDSAVRDPVVIAEGLSPSTERQDRLAKVQDYKMLPCVREIALLSIDEPRAELFRRQSDGTWLEQPATITETLVLTALAVDVPFEEIYTGIEF